MGKAKERTGPTADEMLDLTMSIEMMRDTMEQLHEEVLLLRETLRELGIPLSRRDERSPVAPMHITSMSKDPLGYCEVTPMHVHSRRRVRHGRPIPIWR